ncbi:MAG: HemK2/MTQ2 family protein methyltransferase [Methanotrichaceae archaeon]
MQKSSLFEETYEPAEDTLLLLKAALNEVKPEDMVIEVGCGRGLISLELAKRVRSIIATDINPNAVRLAKSYGLEVVRADIFGGLKAKFDLVIFNPPYLPTSGEERTSGWINYALDGGENGRETINRFLEMLKYHLNPNGRCLLLVSSLSGLKDIKEKAQVEGFKTIEVANERCFFEQLYVLKLEL